MADRAVQVNTQGVGIYILLKKLNGQMIAVIEGECKFMGKEAASRTNPDKGCAEKRNKNM